jgi:hypothetical protein
MSESLSNELVDRRVPQIAQIPSARVRQARTAARAKLTANAYGDADAVILTEAPRNQHD